jgi:heme-degrading monooxygenase HmoA
MIVRTWRGRVGTERASEYERHFRNAVLPELSDIGGHEGAYLLRRDGDGQTQFLVTTLWASMDAIRRFAGADPEAAVVEPGAEAALDDWDRRVEHFEVLHRPS